MCVGCCCDCLYQVRCCFFRLSSLLMLLDLALTIYIIIQLASLDVFACCADNKTLNSQCSYSHIGGASNVGIDSSGYCIEKSTDTDCEGNLATCASTQCNVDMSTLCSQQILDEIAHTNWDWLMGILVTKAVGVVFLIVLEFRSVYKSLKKKREEAARKQEPGEEDVEATVGCCQKCRHWSWDCCKNCFTKTTVFTLKLFFLLFGTAATTLAIWILLFTDRVTFSSCDLISDSTLKNDCFNVQKNCTFDGGQNFYLVVYNNLNLTGPYIVDLTTSVASTVIWIVRFAVLRYYLNSTTLASV